MSTSLKSHFPMLWDKKELLWEIERRPDLSEVFDNWKPKYQEEFINFCTGVKGVKTLYDGFFKEIMNAEYTPERLDEFLSLLLGKKVTVKAVLPNDSTRIADESTLIITDIVVEAEDGSLANIEVQKVGYHFPGQRSACYSSDLLLRQYKRVRREKGKAFSYKDIQDVYTIVLYEKSPSEFKKFPDKYLHHFSHQSNTGLELNLLQKFLFIPLDIFLEVQHNKGDRIDNALDAWLLFFSSDDPKDILNLIEKYPRFQAMYEQAYQICRNVEDVMGLFSEELRILDRNTVQLMVDEMQKDIDTKKEMLKQQDEQIEQKNEQITQQSERIAQQSERIAQQSERIAQQSEQITQKDEQITQKDEQIMQQSKQLTDKDAIIAQLQEALKKLEKTKE